jgi:16S rRNA G1207 methylase RsmC
MEHLEVPMGGLQNNLGTFDRIIMNPPFENAIDIKHIKHALTMLNPGGRIVALCAKGPRQREAFKVLPSIGRICPQRVLKNKQAGNPNPVFCSIAPQTPIFKLELY